MKKYLVVFAAAVVGGFSSLGAYKLFFDTPPTVLGNGQAIPTRLTSLPPGGANDFTVPAEMTVKTVVFVKTTYNNKASQGSSRGRNPFDFFNFDMDGFDFGPRGPQNGSGSGVIISEDGYIITNNHVVEDADVVEITLDDKRTFKAEVIGTDPTTDLALVKINQKGLQYVKFGNSDDVKIGQWVLAVGNPFNLTSTVTAGIVSAKARNINIIAENPRAGAMAVESFIQTDAAVNPGNSGGALVNLNGELVGINTAIASNTGAYSGYSFAVPVNIVRKVANDLLEFGEVQRGFLGVSIQEITSDLADSKGIKDIQGVYISGVADDGAAKDAGLQEGDIIMKVNGIAVNSPSELQEIVARNRPGDKVTLDVKRDDRVRPYSVTLKNKNGSTSIVKTERVSVAGAEFEVLSKEEKTKLKIENGVKVTAVDGGILRSYGIKEGFIITDINSKPMNTVDDIKTALETRNGRTTIKGIYPDGTRAFFSF